MIVYEEFSFKLFVCDALDPSIRKCDGTDKAGKNKNITSTSPYP